MLQFYLLAENVKLASIGTGRMNFPLCTTDEDFDLVQDKLLSACSAMQTGGWWSSDVQITSSKDIYIALLSDIVGAHVRNLKRSIIPSSKIEKRT